MIRVRIRAKNINRISSEKHVDSFTSSLSCTNQEYPIYFSNVFICDEALGVFKFDDTY